MKYYLVFIFLPIVIFGQETPYYKKPGERVLHSDRHVVPNLNAQEIKISVYAGVGMNFIRNRLSQESKYLTPDKGTDTFFDLGLGLNKNYDWKFFLGFQQFEFTQRAYFSFPVIFGPSSISYRNKVIQIPIQFSKRIIYLNRVSKAAFLNLDLGLCIVPREINSASNFNLLGAVNNYQVLDTLNIISNNYTPSPPVSAFGGLEIGGKVFKLLDIGLIYRLNFKPNGFIRTETEITKNSSFSEKVSILAPNIYSSVQLRLIWNLGILQKFEKHY